LYSSIAQIIVVNLPFCYTNTLQSWNGTKLKPIAIELYIDDVERVIHKLNEIESDENRLVNFNCEICDDENWDNVASLLYEEE